jgi:hypothetical protein
LANISRWAPSAALEEKSGMVFVVAGYYDLSLCFVAFYQGQKDDQRTGELPPFAVPANLIIDARREA